MILYKNNEQLIAELKKIYITENITATQVATTMGMTRQGYHTLTKKKNFAFADMKRICDVIGYDLKIEISPKEQV